MVILSIHDFVNSTSTNTEDDVLMSGGEREDSSSTTKTTPTGIFNSMPRENVDRSKNVNAGKGYISHCNPDELKSFRRVSHNLPSTFDDDERQDKTDRLSVISTVSVGTWRGMRTYPIETRISH